MSNDSALADSILTPQPGARQDNSSDCGVYTIVFRLVRVWVVATAPNDFAQSNLSPLQAVIHARFLIMAVIGTAIRYLLLTKCTGISLFLFSL